MGWHASGLIVQGNVDPAQFPGLPRASGQQLSGDEVYSDGFAGEFATASVGAWNVVADPQLQAAFDDSLVAGLSRGSRALAFVTHGVSTVRGFAWYVDGSAIRRVIYAEGEVAEEYGAPIAEEAGLPDPIDEDYVFEIVARLTGMDWADIAEASYSVFTESS